METTRCAWTWTNCSARASRLAWAWASRSGETVETAKIPVIASAAATTDWVRKPLGRRLVMDIPDADRAGLGRANSERRRLAWARSVAHWPAAARNPAVDRRSLADGRARDRSDWRVVGSRRTLSRRRDR